MNDQVKNIIKRSCLGLSLIFVFSGVACAGEDIPFKIAGRVIFVKTILNGKGPFSFILDSGASQTLVTPPTASKLGIKSYRSVSLLKGKVDSIAVGSANLNNLSVYIYDPPQALPLRLNNGINYHGILGFTFLSRFITTIDYLHGRVEFSALSEVPVVRRKRGKKDGAYLLPFTIKQGLIYVTGKINGVTLRLLVDTGSAEVVILPGAAAKLKLVSPREVNRKSPAKFIKLDSVMLGDAEVRDIEAVIHRPAGERAISAGYDGIVGYPFLSKFKVTLNYRDRILIFR